MAFRNIFSVNFSFVLSFLYAFNIDISMIIVHSVYILRQNRDKTALCWMYWDGNDGKK